jgi:predicted Zn-dependent protease
VGADLVQGQPAEGERLALELIKVRKDAAPIYDLLFLHYRSQNRLADAESIMRSKVDNNPREINFALELATFYAAAGKRNQIAEILQRLLDDPRTFPDARLRIGDFYAALNDWPEALRQYLEGAKVDSKNKIVYLKRIADGWLLQDKSEEAAAVVARFSRSGLMMKPPKLPMPRSWSRPVSRRKCKPD